MPKVYEVKFEFDVGPVIADSDEEARRIALAWLRRNGAEDIDIDSVECLGEAIAGVQE